MPLTLLPGYDTLVFGPYDHTGAFPRIAVRPGDPIQNRGHDTTSIVKLMHSTMTKLEIKAAI